MRFARGLMIVAYGLVTIAAQTLLFREFITAFEGNDIAVGVFFGSWFLWVGLGAALVRRRDRFAETLARHIEVLFLLYVPAFVVQHLLILNVRGLAGVASYDLLSVQTIVLWSMVVNAPVSLVTGALFPVACRWVEQVHAFPVSRVYTLEAIGSFIGGLAVTALLAWRVPMIRVFLLLSLALSISAAVSCLSSTSHRRRYAIVVSIAVVASSLAILFTGADHAFVRSVQTAKWSKLLPREALRGAFQTAQAEYLYGQYSGQWIAMREGAVCEALPNEEEAGRIAATVLCQNPQAKRVLVIGSGLALCKRLMLLPQIEHVAWAHPDAEYAGCVLNCLPDEFAVNDARFHPVTGEVRQYVAGAPAAFDVVILSLPDVAGSAFNRYYTAEFYQQVKASLRPEGIVAVSIAGGEDVIGAELVGLGASTRKTLATVFPNQILVPGEQTWLIASDNANLTSDPATVRDRFAAMAGSQWVFPAAGLLSVYLPDRIAEATRAYDKTGLPERLLVNRDSHPLADLYGLLLAARQSGASVTRFVKLLALGGWLPFVVPVLVFAALRVLATAGHNRGPGPSTFDADFLVFSTGWVGIAVVIVLMYSYETRFGSLYLHVGLISSLFMAGLTLGAWLVGRAVARWVSARSLDVVLVGILFIHAFVLAILALGWTDGTRGHGLFAMAFVLAGLCCGGYWPVAAAQLAGSLTPSDTGSRLETADHLGACLGGLATSLLMVPILGTRTSLLALIGLVLANVPAAILGLRSHNAASIRAEPEVLRQAGYVLFGVAACVVLCSNLLVRASERLQPTLPSYVVAALAGEQQTRRASVALNDGSRRVEYVDLIGGDQKPVGYVFSSADFAPEVRGFGGKFNLAIRTDASGKLAGLVIVRSNETPSYLDLLGGWLDSLKGRTLPLSGVNAVAGATVSSEAILAAIQTSGQRFAVEVLKDDSYGGTQTTRAVDAASLYLAATALLAFAAVWAARAWGRVAVLALTFLLGGVFLNTQYSTEQLATLLSLDVPGPGLTGAFLLVAGVPILVLLFGNLYCGYLCPFGAAQELLGYVLPRRLRPDPTRDPMRAARFIKYIVLAVFVVGFFIARDRRVLGPDPLTSVFALATPAHRSLLTLGIAGAILVGSLFHVRFWCRYLCPAGAFLSLLNRVRLLRRLIPVKRFGRCEFGLTAADHRDCLYCDRCRRPKRFEISDLKSQMGVRTPLFVAAIVLGLLVSGLSLSRLRYALPEVLQESASSVESGGKPRDVDVRQIRTLIEQGRLSNREAEHYKRMD